MDNKTKRIVKQTLKNLAKLVVFSIAIISYILICMSLSYYYSGDIYFGLAAFFLPMIIFAIWDMSKSQVETQIYQEDLTMQALSRKYE